MSETTPLLIVAPSSSYSSTSTSPHPPPPPPSAFLRTSETAPLITAAPSSSFPSPPLPPSSSSSSSPLPSSAPPLPIYIVPAPRREDERTPDQRSIYAAKMMFAYITSLVFGWLACVSAYIARETLDAGPSNLATVVFATFGFTALNWFIEAIFRGDFPGKERLVSGRAMVYRDGHDGVPIVLRFIILATEIGFYMASASIAIVYNMMLMLLFLLIAMFSQFVRVYFGVVALAHNSRGYWYDFPAFMGQCDPVQKERK